MDGLRGGVGSVVSTAPSPRIWPLKHLGQTEREKRTPSTQAEVGLAWEREAAVMLPASRLQTQSCFRRATTGQQEMPMALALPVPEDSPLLPAPGSLQRNGK